MNKIKMFTQTTQQHHNNNHNANIGNLILLKNITSKCYLIQYTITILYTIIYITYIYITYFYNLYYITDPDGTAHDNIAIIIRNNIYYYELDNFKTDFLQATTVEIEDWSGSVVVSFLYCSLKLIIANEQFKAFFEILGARFIAVRDYNAKH